MLTLTKKNAQLFYALVQMLYWMAFGLMFSFASAYLQAKGFFNGGIGLVLGCSYGISTLLQPSIASVLQRMGVQAEKGLCALYTLAALLSALILWAPLPGMGVALIFTLLLSLYSALQPLVNSLAQRWSDAGCPVDFSTARSGASLLFAATIGGMGWLLGKVSAVFLPAFYLTVIFLSVCIFLLVKFPGLSEQQARPSTKSGHAKSKFPAGFPLLLMGIACLSLAHILIDNFMLQINPHTPASLCNRGNPATAFQ